MNQRKQKETGFVKWFHEKKGYGFIARHWGGEDLFVHHREIKNQKGRRTLFENDRVRFITVEGKKGLEAKEVEVLYE